MNRILFIILALSYNFLYANQGLRVSKSEKQITLSNEDLTLTFADGDSFRLLHLSDSKGKTWTVPEDKGLLWQLMFIDQNGSPLLVNSENAQYVGAELSEEQDNKSVNFTWSYALGGDLVGKVHVTVSVDGGSTLSTWDIRSDFPAGWEVDDLNFPVITLEKSQQTKMILPAQWGAEYDLHDMTNQRFLNRYPSSRSAVQLMLLREQDDVFYFATHDAKANFKTFSARVSGTDVEFMNNITPSAAWNDNGKFNLPWSASVGLSDKGWEDAITKWYRPFTFETEWGKTKIVDKQYPQWLLDSDLWLVGGHVNDAELKRTHDAITYFGPQTSFHWYYWHNAPFDTKYPEYLPAKEGFDNIISEVQNRGSHVVPYINGRLWDVDTESYINDGGKQATILNQDKTRHTEIYASEATNAVICPTSVIWKQKLVELTDQIQGDVVKADGVYYDQVAASRALPCYDETHDHPPGGGSFWVDSYREIFREAKAVSRPNSILSTEQNTEAYLDMFDLFLMVNYPQGTAYQPVPLFQIIYSDRALLYGFYIFNNANMSFRVKNALTLLWGAQLNGGRTEFVQYPSMVENAAFLKDLVAFRKKSHDLFVGGRLLKEITPDGDNPKISVPNWPANASTTGTSSAVRGALWESKNGTYAIVLVNVDEYAHNVKLPSGGAYISMKPGECVRIDINETELNNFI